MRLRKRVIQCERCWERFDGAAWLFQALLPSARAGSSPNIIPRVDTETVWDSPGTLILSHTHLREEELMRPAQGRGLFTYLSGACSGPICLWLWGYLLVPRQHAMSRRDNWFECVCVWVRKRDVRWATHTVGSSSINQDKAASTNWHFTEGRSFIWGALEF